MSTELSTISSLSFEDVAALTGAVMKNEYIPRLKINRDPVDEDGNDIPVGTFSISQGDVTVYGKEAKFRLFINSYQYQEYDPSIRKFTNRSITIKNFNEQALDELGGVACGKLSKDALEKATDTEKLRQRNIKCGRLMYGLITLPDAKGADGKVQPVVDLPVLFKLAGSNFMAPREALDAITKMKHPFFQHYLSLSLKREKQGSNTYYSVHIVPDLKNDIKWQESDMEIFSLFQDTIERENRFVMAKWTAVKNSRVNDIRDRDILSALDLNDDISDL